MNANVDFVRNMSSAFGRRGNPWYVIARVVVFSTLFMTPVLGACPDHCVLPDCYCDYNKSPLGIPDPPQIIQFVFLGTITEFVRDELTDVFPDTIKNPNGCPIGITLFVISEGSDPCMIHRMYVRGHEIALAGINRTSGDVGEWTEIKWEKFLADQRTQIVDDAFVPLDDIQGVRAQRQKPGGDDQFNMLYKEQFRYDSSLLAGPVTFESIVYPWPFTLDTNLKDLGFECRNPPCPQNSYAGFWENPIVPMIGYRGKNVIPCTYLDDCIVGLKRSSDVRQILEKNFDLHYDNSRSPLQIGIQAKTLRSKIAMSGLKEFLEVLTRKPDVWMVTMQETLRWMENPKSATEIADDDTWDCSQRTFNRKCSSSVLKKKKNKMVTLNDIVDTSQFWIWQTILLVVLYAIIYKYDRESKKK